jgi:hypothetical protein
MDVEGAGRRVWLLPELWLRQPDDGAAQIRVDRVERLDHVLGERHGDGAGRRRELRPPTALRPHRVDTGRHAGSRICYLRVHRRAATEWRI